MNTPYCDTCGGLVKLLDEGWVHQTTIKDAPPHDVTVQEWAAEFDRKTGFPTS